MSGRFAMTGVRAGRLAGAAALLAGLVAAAGTARAEVADATVLFRQGVEALRRDEFPEAASLFRLSYELEVRAATQCNLALTYERWGGHDMEALEAYRRCAEDDGDGRFRPRALERAQAIRQRLEAEGGPAGPERPAEPAGAGGASPPPPAAGRGGGETGPPAARAGRAEPRRGLVISHPLLWTGAAVALVGAASLGTAIGLHVWADGVHEELSNEYEGRTIPRESADAQRVERGSAGVGAAIGLYVVGGVLAAVAVVLIAIDLTQESSELEASLIGALPLPGGLAGAAGFRF